MKEISKKNLTKQEQGITLVALIITIIILIILAAVTIMSVTKNNLVGIATDGTQNYARAQVDESKKMDDMAQKLKDTVENIEEIQGKPVSPTAVYVKAYQDGTLIISSTDYVDKSRGTYVDYGDISKTYIYYPEWASQNIKQVIVYDRVVPLTIENWFIGCSTIESMDLSKLKTNNITSMSHMFNGCSNLMSLDLGNFNTANVTNMGSMFEGCSNLMSLDLGNFNTANVTNMGSMFEGCSNLRNLDLGNFDTSNTESMSSMFNGCSNLMSLNLENFNTANVVSMNYMFRECENLRSLDLSNFKTYRLCTMTEMFENCASLRSLDLSSFEINNEVGDVALRDVLSIEWIIFHQYEGTKDDGILKIYVKDEATKNILCSENVLGESKILSEGEIIDPSGGGVDGRTYCV